MKFRPILFSTEMVQAILTGRKTQTRRIVKPQPNNDVNYHIEKLPKYGEDIFGMVLKKNKLSSDLPPFNGMFSSPFCFGDILWVRETFFCTKYYEHTPLFTNKGKYVYKATDNFIGCYKWGPSLHMPKEAARIFLLVKSVRVERMQDITETDAIEEGADHGRYLGIGKIGGSFREGFFQLWDRINGSGSVMQNPWVWVIEFERIEKPENF